MPRYGRRRLHAPPLSRWGFLRYGGAAAEIVGADRLLPAYLRSGTGLQQEAPDILDGSEGPIELILEETDFQVDGRRGKATTVNGTILGPLLRFREGDEAVIHVTNRLDEDSSIHWYGILLPNAMDGVPNVTFPGIRPGETFTYRFLIRQYGTYWYHSLSGLQEQTGHYGPLVIDPAQGEPEPFDREHVVVLSDWTFEDPHRILAKLKKQPDYYNFQKRTVFDFFRDVAEHGLGTTVRDRLDWGSMRMSPTDISDITGATYTYLINGKGPEVGWSGLFQPEERVRLRFINISAASLLDVRIPGLPMKVMQVSGQHVRPVETDEIRIAIAERYDVIVEPTENRTYTIFAEAVDRSGFARATLTPRLDMDMVGMDMDMGGNGHGGHAARHGGRGAGRHARDGRRPSLAGMAMGLRPPGTLPEDTMHGPDTHGKANASVPMSTQSRLAEPGLGLDEDGWWVLTYADLEVNRPGFIGDCLT